jgi:type I restriction enzyme S subunit
MSFARYPEYKDSRIGFLGKIPIHWALKRLKHCAEVFPSNVDKKSVEGQVSVKLCNYTDVYYNEIIDAELNFMSATATKAQIRRFELQQGDVVFTKDSESANDIGVAALVPHSLPGVIYGYHLSIARAQDFVSGNFLKRYFDSKETKAYFETSANGLTRVGLGQYAVDNAPIALPSLGEQTQVARFLDYETAKIDTLIREQERLIDLLQEKRQAVISHAVTKGLDPDVPMKDSGVEWLGEVPAHWDVTRIGWKCAVGNGCTPSRDRAEYWQEGQHPWLNSSVVNQQRVKNSDQFVTDQALKECALPRVRKGSVLIAITGEGKTRGMATITEIDATINQHIAFIEPRDTELSAVFLHDWLVANYHQLRFESNGYGSTKAAITCGDIRAYPLPLPPLIEQRNISDFLENASSQFDELTVSAKKSIALLTERRSALISAAVTGKIDVRNWRPPVDESAFDESVRQAGMEVTA